MMMMKRLMIRYYMHRAETVINSKGHTFTLIKSNRKLETFYRRLMKDENEWNQCLDAMRRDLPQTFRLNSARVDTSMFLKDYLERTNNALEPLKWYRPSGFAWKVPNKSRWDLLNRPELNSIHQFIAQNRLLGHLYRQEAVSMVPVAFLDVQPHHFVLDICASPGSKTTQALEAASSDKAGLVVANEFDIKRRYALISNLKMIGSSAKLLVVHHDGRVFPEIRLDGSKIRYDRIICDVPCSGDGTLRKNPNVWTNWHPIRGNSRHHLQYAIARRAASLLKVGGIMVYSSCSMNQVENEAVLARLISESRGSLRIIDPPISIPSDLHYEPGLSSWTLFDSDMNEMNEYRRNDANIGKEMFPSIDADRIGLERTLRFLPHHNDDGGFFVGYVRRISESTFPPNEKEIFETNGTTNSVKSHYSRYSRVAEDLRSTLDYFGSSYDVSQFQSNGNRRIRLLSSTVSNVLAENPELRVLSAGVEVMKTVKLRDNKSVYTFTRRGDDHPLLRDSTKRLFRLTVKELKSLVTDTEYWIQETELPSPGPIILTVDEIHVRLVGFVHRDGRISIENLGREQRDYLLFRCLGKVGD